MVDAAGQRLPFQNGWVVAIDVTEGMVISQKGKPMLTLSEDGHVYANGDAQGANVSLSKYGHDGVTKGEEKADEAEKIGWEFCGGGSLVKKAHALCLKATIHEEKRRGF